MKANKIIYWTATAIISLMMIFSAYNYMAKPEIAAAFKHLGFPDYFRVELAIAKIIGALVIIIPQVPVKIKEWAYAGFTITFISATIAHAISGDPTQYVVMPIIFLAVLLVSNIFLYKQGRLSIAI